MRRINKILIGLFVVVCSFVSSAVTFASSEEVKYELPGFFTDDPLFTEPIESINMAFSYIERGDREFRHRPGQAQKYYEHAEDYLLKAVFMLKEIGVENGIDVSDEVAYCNGFQREVHVKTSDARKKARNR